MNEEYEPQLNSLECEYDDEDLEEEEFVDIIDNPQIVPKSSRNGIKSYFDPEFNELIKPENSIFERMDMSTKEFVNEIDKACIDIISKLKLSALGKLYGSENNGTIKELLFDDEEVLEFEKASPVLCNILSPTSNFGYGNDRAHQLFSQGKHDKDALLRVYPIYFIRKGFFDRNPKKAKSAFLQKTFLDNLEKLLMAKMKSLYTSLYDKIEKSEKGEICLFSVISAQEFINNHAYLSFEWAHEYLYLILEVKKK